MEHIVFERPREKLQTKGVGYLSTTELLQIIIGSGTANISSARLAKRVMTVLTSNQLTLETLVSMEGIGLARACQIIAAKELGERMKGIKSREDKGGDNDDFLQIISKAVSRLRKNTLIVYMYDGAERQLLRQEYETTPVRLITRKACADALAMNARRVTIAIGCKDRDLSLMTDELILVKQLKASLNLLDILLTNVYVANQKRAEIWKL